MNLEKCEINLAWTWVDLLCLAKHCFFVWLWLSNQTKLSGLIWMKLKLKSKLERHYWNNSCWIFPFLFLFFFLFLHRNKSCFGLVLFSSWAKLNKIFYLCLLSASTHENGKSCWFLIKGFSWSSFTYFHQNVRSLTIFWRLISSRQTDSSRTKSCFCLKYEVFQPKRQRETLMLLLKRLNQITIPNVKL